jgi:thymidylate kinase
LNLEGVRYCHWKSNVRLAQALRGQTDLDLLVDRQHSQLFRRILSEFNIKPLLSAPSKDYPAIESYLGFDPQSGDLFHLHVHYHLVLGEQFVKNYRLPLEAHFLDSVRLRYGVQVPSPELELIVLSIRALLKYRDRDAVKDFLTIRSAGLPAGIRKEINWLLGQTSISRISQTLAELNAIVPADVVLGFLQIVATDPRDGYRLFRLRNQLRQALRPYQRYHRLQASLKYFRQVWHRRKRFPKSTSHQKMTPVNGGLAIALIGADGSGKSTMCQILSKWLAWKLDVRLHYLGSKKPSRRSELLYTLFRIARRSSRVIGPVFGKKNVLTQSVEAIRQVLLYSHHLSIGFDRYRRFQESRRQVAAGSIVIYDRFPLEAPLDGPKIQLIANDEGGYVASAFSKWEQDIYSKFRPPDFLLALDVSPEVSLQRKPDHDLAAIEAKVRLVRKLIKLNSGEAGQPTVLHFVADQPFDVVLSQLKATIWRLL